MPTSNPDRSPESVERVIAALRDAHARHPAASILRLIDVARHLTNEDPFCVENDALATALGAIEGDDLE